MRFIKLQSGEVVFDLSSRMKGRGFYVCSSDVCLARFEKGKLKRFPVKPSQAGSLKKKMLESLADEINCLLELCMKMGFARTDLYKETTGGDVIILKQYATDKSKETINNLNQHGYMVFKDICDPVKLKSDMLIINALWPMRDKLINNLNLFKRLFFRGAAL